jgi:hypothetical protein
LWAALTIPPTLNVKTAKLIAQLKPLSQCRVFQASKQIKEPGDAQRVT